MNLVAAAFALAVSAWFHTSRYSFLTRDLLADSVPPPPSPPRPSFVAARAKPTEPAASADRNNPCISKGRKQKPRVCYGGCDVGKLERRKAPAFVSPDELCNERRSCSFASVFFLRAQRPRVACGNF